MSIKIRYVNTDNANAIKKKIPGIKKSTTKHPEGRRGGGQKEREETRGRSSGRGERRRGPRRRADPQTPATASICSSASASSSAAAHSEAVRSERHHGAAGGPRVCCWRVVLPTCIGTSVTCLFFMSLNHPLSFMFSRFPPSLFSHVLPLSF